MADFSDDYVIVGASSDNFDCDATGGWTEGGNGSAVATNSECVEGSYSLDLTASNSGSSNWYHDVSSGNRFKITEKDLHFWFKYVKGKGANFLTQDGTAVVIRLYFGGTSKYADYRCTTTGDLELKFGWQLLSASGKNLRGGSTGGGHNGTTDYDLDIYRIDLRLNFSNKNDTPLGMDCWFIGTKITVTKGTSSAPATLQDLADYSNDDRTAFPLGVVDIQQTLAYIRCGLTIGDGNSGTGHQAYMTADSKFILMKQLSTEVKHHLVVNNYSTLVLGEKETGSDDNYFVRGCQLVLPASRYSDITVNNGATLKLYDTKVYRWRYVYLGASSDTSSTVELRRVDFDSCECVYFRSNTLNMDDVEVHDATTNNVQQGCEFIKEPDSIDYTRIYKCAEGAYFRDTMEVTGVSLTDNTNYDIGILEGKTVSLIDSKFSSSKLRRLT